MHLRRCMSDNATTATERKKRLFRFSDGPLNPLPQRFDCQRECLRSPGEAPALAENQSTLDVVPSSGIKFGRPISVTLTDSSASLLASGVHGEA
jgi:hypothetical protein